GFQVTQDAAQVGGFALAFADLEAPRLPRLQLRRDVSLGVEEEDAFDGRLEDARGLRGELGLRAEQRGGRSGGGKPAGQFLVDDLRDLRSGVRRGDLRAVVEAPEALDLLRRDAVPLAG